VIQRLSLDRVSRPVPVYFPASGAAYFERLRAASVFTEQATVVPHPVTGAGEVAVVDAFRILAQPLRHPVDTLGWRLEEEPGVRMLPRRLEAAGVRGPDIGRLQAEGSIDVGGATVRLEEVSTTRPGQTFAFVMDTAPCPGATALAAGADLLVAESTFLTPEQELAEAWGHMTAAATARLAAEAGARRLVLTHFSQRHPDEAAFLAEAAPIFSEAVAARDLMTVEVPRRRVEGDR
jgi:ribonuclease Z